MNPWGLLASLVFSMVGLVYLKQGKNEGDVTRMVCGVALLAYSYFVPGVFLVVVVGALLTALPFMLKKF